MHNGLTDRNCHSGIFAIFRRNPGFTLNRGLFRYPNGYSYPIFVNTVSIQDKSGLLLLSIPDFGLFGTCLDGFSASLPVPSDKHLAALASACEFFRRIPHSGGPIEPGVVAKVLQVGRRTQNLEDFGLAFVESLGDHCPNSSVGS